MERSASRSMVLLALALALALVCVVGGVAAQGAIDVTAYWANYYAKEHNWDMREESVFCYPWDANKPLEWRSKYHWTAFCGPRGPRGREACGKCLNVTNVGVANIPKPQITVRIVDDCSRESLDLDWPAFHQLDTDGKGNERGHLTVDYVFVDCHDTTIRLYSQKY